MRLHGREAAEDSKPVNLRNPNEYNLVVVENPNRKNSSSQNVPKDLNIGVGNNVIEPESNLTCRLKVCADELFVTAHA